MPICSIGDELYIFVLFAVESIQLTPNAVDFLCGVARAVSENTSGFLPASNFAAPSQANTERFIGVWDMMELFKTYSNVAFHFLPIGRMQKYLDFQESSSFRDILSESKQMRDSRFAPKQTDNEFNRLRSNSTGSEGSTSWTFDECEQSFERFPSLMNEHYLEPNAYAIQLSTKVQGKTRTGVLMNDASSDYAGTDHDELSSTNDSENGFWMLPNSSIDSRTAYTSNRNRFHEFMTAVLGMTMFDAAEIWLAAPDAGSGGDAMSELHVVAAMHREGALRIWTPASKDMRISMGMDVPGSVWQRAQPFWDTEYSQHVSSQNESMPLSSNSKQSDADGPDQVSEQSMHPRAGLAAALGIHTAFGVPLPGPEGGVSGVFAMYSQARVAPEPLMISLVQRAVELLSASAVDPQVLHRLGIESLVHDPRPIMEQWLNDSDLVDSDKHGDKERGREVTLAAVPEALPHTTIITTSTALVTVTAMGKRGHKGLPVVFSAPSLSRERSKPRRDLLTTSHQTLAAPAHGIRSRNPSPPGQQSTKKARVTSRHDAIAADTNVRRNSFPGQSKSENTDSAFNLLVFTAGLVQCENCTSRTDDYYEGVSASLSTDSVVLDGAVAASSDTPPVSSRTGFEMYPTPSAMVQESWTDPSDPHGAVIAQMQGHQMWNVDYHSPDSIPRALQHQQSTAAISGVESSFGDVGMGWSNVLQAACCVVAECGRELADGSSDHCVVHTGQGFGAVRRCLHQGCTKCAQGSTNYCIAHGGGRRCTFPGCVKGARDKFFCAGHGGGKVCSH